MTPPKLAFLPNRVVAMGPYQVCRAFHHAVAIPAARRDVDRVLDEMFAKPSQGAVRYFAAGERLYLSWARIGGIRGLGGEDPNRGVAPELEAALWAPAFRVGHDAPARWVPLVMYVDAGPAVAAGREVYGIPKHAADLDLPASPPPSLGPFRARAMAISSFGTSAVAGMKPVIEMRAADGAAAADVAEEERETGAAEAFLRDLPDAEAAAVAEALGVGAPTDERRIVMACLKQFPAADDPEAACFQSIVEAESRTLRVHREGVISAPVQVRFHSHDNHPFDRALGIPDRWMTLGPVYWAEFDARMELGRDIWRA